MYAGLYLTDWFDSAQRWASAAWARTRQGFQSAEPWQRVVIAAAGLFVLALLLPALLALIVAALVVSLVALWVREFVIVMRTPDDAFPGRHDRWIWLAVMLVFAPFGPIAFWLFRHNQWPEGQPPAVGRAQKSHQPWDDEGWL